MNKRSEKPLSKATQKSHIRDAFKKLGEKELLMFEGKQSAEWKRFLIGKENSGDNRERQAGLSSSSSSSSSSSESSSDSDSVKYASKKIKTKRVVKVKKMAKTDLKKNKGQGKEEKENRKIRVLKTEKSVGNPPKIDDEIVAATKLKATTRWFHKNVANIAKTA